MKIKFLQILQEKIKILIYVCIKIINNILEIARQVSDPFFRKTPTKEPQEEIV